MRRLDASPNSFALEIAAGVWPQIGVMPAAAFGAIRRGLEQLAERLGQQVHPQSETAVSRTGLFIDGDYIASYTVNTARRRVTLTAIGRRMDVML